MHACDWWSLWGYKHLVADEVHEQLMLMVLFECDCERVCVCNGGALIGRRECVKENSIISLLTEDESHKPWHDRRAQNGWLLLLFVWFCFLKVSLTFKMHWKCEKEREALWMSLWSLVFCPWEENAAEERMGDCKKRSLLSCYFMYHVGMKGFFFIAGKISLIEAIKMSVDGTVLKNSGLNDF